MIPYYSVAAAEEFWTEHWGGHSPVELLRIAERSPLTTLIERALPGEGLVFEAGCGLGQYVMLLRRRGHRAFGADWSVDALRSGRRAEPGTPLVAMNLAGLAVRSGSVAAYVSLGVVEHDPSGPDAILAEAARVLQSGGILVLSVPYVNGARRIAVPYLAWHGRRVRAAGGAFYQFAFTRREVRAFLDAHGFTVRSFHPYDPGRLLRKALRRLAPALARTDGQAPASIDAPATEVERRPRTAGRSRRASAAARRLLYSEPALRLLGHMILAVAVKER